MEEFNKLRRRWLIEVAFECITVVGLFVTFLIGGETNNLIFWAVLFLWSKLDADRAYDNIMKY